MGIVCFELPRFRTFGSDGIETGTQLVSTRSLPILAASTFQIPMRSEKNCKYRTRPLCLNGHCWTSQQCHPPRRGTPPDQPGKPPMGPQPPSNRPLKPPSCSLPPTGKPWMSPDRLGKPPVRPGMAPVGPGKPPVEPENGSDWSENPKNQRFFPKGLDMPTVRAGNARHQRDGPRLGGYSTRRTTIDKVQGPRFRDT